MPMRSQRLPLIPDGSTLSQVGHHTSTPYTHPISLFYQHTPYEHIQRHSISTSYGPSVRPSPHLHSFLLAIRDINTHTFSSLSNNTSTPYTHPIYTRAPYQHTLRTHLSTPSISKTSPTPPLHSPSPLPLSTPPLSHTPLPPPLWHYHYYHYLNRSIRRCSSDPRITTASDSGISSS